MDSEHYNIDLPDECGRSFVSWDDLEGGSVVYRKDRDSVDDYYLFLRCTEDSVYLLVGNSHAVWDEHTRLPRAFDFPGLFWVMENKPDGCNH